MEGMRLLFINFEILFGMDAPRTNTIFGLVVHKLIKARQGEADFVPRDSLVDVTPTVQRLIDQIHKLYAERQSKGYGKFEDDEDNFPMHRYARDYFVDKKISFYDLSVAMMRTLKKSASNAPLSTGGFVLITHVSNGANDFILVALVTDVLGTTITEGLEIVDSTHLDIANLRVAGRIDLTGWQDGEERYISFLKGKGDVAEYFKEFLGCNDIVVARQETQKLIGCLKRFADTNKMDPAEKDKLLKGAHDWCTELSNSNMPVDLTALANLLWPADPKVLHNLFADEQLQLSDGFIPDKRSLRSLVRFSGKTASWRIDFERDALRNGEIDFDPDNETLTLKKLPQQLLSELKSEQGDG
jgi:nucleoid-associated protein